MWKYEEAPCEKCRVNNDSFDKINMKKWNSGNNSLTIPRSEWDSGTLTSNLRNIWDGCEVRK